MFSARNRLAVRLLRRAPAILVSILALACGSTEERPDSGPVYPDAYIADSGQRRDAGVRDGASDETDAASEDGGEKRTYTFWQDVQPVIQAKCGLCHGHPANYGAPRSLTKYADMMAVNTFGQPIHELVAYRIVALTGAMPPVNQPQLTMEEKAMIQAWSTQGALEGIAPPEADGGVDDGGTDGGTDAGIVLPWADGGTSPSPGPGLRYIDVFAHRAGDRTMPHQVPRAGSGTSYTCWYFTIPAGSGADEVALAFEPFIDQSRFVHHVFLYINTETPAPEHRGDAFECIDTAGGGRIIASWFPGRGNTVMPENTGIPIDSSAHTFTLEVHYDSVPNGGVPDMSGMRVLLSEEQGLTPIGELWAGIDWTGQLPGPGNVSLQGTYTFTSNGVTIFTATPHMHRKGVHLSLLYQRGGQGDWVPIVDGPWDFANQVLWDIDPPLVFNAGDRLRTTCEWSTANGPIIQGAGSQAEMCYVFMYHYRLNAPLMPIYGAVVNPDP